MMKTGVPEEVANVRPANLIMGPQTMPKKPPPRPQPVQTGPTPMDTDAGSMATTNQVAYPAGTTGQQAAAGTQQAQIPRGPSLLPDTPFDKNAKALGPNGEEMSVDTTYQPDFQQQAMSAYACGYDPMSMMWWGGQQMQMMQMQMMMHQGAGMTMCTDQMTPEMKMMYESMQDLIPDNTTPGIPTEGKMTGTVKWWRLRKGYGFIIPDEPQPDDKDIFVHNSNILRPPNSGKEGLTAGSQVEFDIEFNDDGKPRAVNVAGIGGVPPEGMYSRRWHNRNSGGGLFDSDGET